LFHQQLEETLNSQYLRIRLTQADQLLRSTGFAVTEIGILCGFRSPSHFSRSFRSQFGVSPVRMRAELLRKRND
jgi:AraC family carnitine catabolism transcriptional activator